MTVGPSVAAVSPLIGWDGALVRTLQDATDGVLLPLVRAVTSAGDITTLTTVVAIIYWVVDARAGRRAATALLVYATLNTGLKNLLALPRPYWVLPDVDALAFESSFGPPSGHAGLAAATYGALLPGIRSRGVRILLVATVAAIGLSRVALGVHWPTDVLLGWLVGSAVAVAVTAGGRALDALHPDSTAGRLVRSPRRATVAAGAVAATLLLVTVAIVMVRSDAPVPEAWITAAQAAGPDAPAPDPRALEGAATAAAALTGFLSGVALVQARGGFRTDGTTGARLGRVALGAVGLGVLEVLGELGPDPEGAGGTLVAVVLLGLTGWWVGGGAPLLFRRLGLAPAAAGAAQ